MRYSFIAFAVCIGHGLSQSSARADAFDQFTNADLAKIAETNAVQFVHELAPKVLADHGGVLRGTTATMLIVSTNENRWAKLLVQPARQKIGNVTTPILLIERYVTFREGTERAIHASGQNIQLYPGLHFNLDLGQVVPDKVGGDLNVFENAKGDRQIATRPAGKAKIYLVTKAPAAAVPPKTARLVVGETFEIRYFNGTYKLHDDGRRSGILQLQVDDAGDVTGSFYSDKDGQKYEVKGKVGNPRHAIQFTIRFPRVEQTFQGFLFTGDAKALAGTTKLQEREAAFYAVRADA